MATGAIGASAFAASPDPAPAKRKALTYSVPDLVQSPGALGPGGAVVTAAKPRQSSLIEVRVDFVPELLRSGDEI
ncbi:MAG: hypothetical protein U1F43_00340 [Myxococcota bacterium]